MARIFLAAVVILVFAGGTIPLFLMGSNNTSDVDMDKVNEALEQARLEQEQEDLLQDQVIQEEINQDNMSDYLTIETLQEGTGKTVEKGSTVLMHYKGMLEDGTVFDSSYDRGQPFETSIGTGMLIKGWDEGVPGMKEGEKAKLTIKSDWAYGDAGIPGAIPGGATLIFEVEVVEVLS